jgi:Domain of unknown function (DUF3841)
MTRFEFKDDISLADIGEFLGSPEDTPVVIWTLQHPRAVECLERTGKLTGDPTFTFARKTPGKRSAYEWLRRMMAKRLSHYSQEWPVWALLTRPTAPSDSPNDVLLRLEIPKAKMLVSFYEGRVKLLGIMEYIELHNDKWPEEWMLYREAPYLCPVLQEDITGHLDVPTPRPWSFDEQQCRSSWEKIFDLTLYGLERFAWDSSSRYPLLQAVVPIIYRSDVTEMLRPSLGG